MLKENLTKQNVILGLLIIAVVYLMYINCTNKSLEKYSIPASFVGDAPDPTKMPYVFTDLQGNLYNSSNLITSSNYNVSVGKNLTVSGRTVIIANAFRGMTSTFTTGVNWITVDGLFRMKYSSGVNAIEWQSIMILPTNVNKPVNAVSLFNANNMPYVTQQLITWSVNSIPPSLTVLYNVRRENRNSPGDTYEILLTCGKTTTANTNSQVCNIYKIFCQVLKSFTFGTNTENAVVFIIEKIYPTDENLTIT